MGKVKRFVALCLFVVLSVFRAAATITLTADVPTACPGEAVVLTMSSTTDISTHLKGYYYSVDDGATWKLCQSQTRVGKAVADFPTDISVTKAIYKVVDEQTKESSNLVEVEKNSSSECSRTCHITSTGDYFSGTDFNTENGSTGKVQIPNDIVTFFDENDIVFTHHEPSSNYTVTTDLSSVFGSRSPSLDTSGNKRGEQNYYYVYESNPHSSTPFQYRFKCSTYAGKNYRYTMRFYAMKKEPNCGGSAAIKLETGHGNQTTDRCAIDIYDDETGDTLKSLYITETFGLINLGLGDASFYDKLLRIEVNYYGHFPDDKYDSRTGKYNGLEFYTLDPLFQQFDGCFNMAIDYISAELESVCMSKGAYCLGDYAVINAAGFPHKADYRWEKLEGAVYQGNSWVGGTWEPVKYNNIVMSGPSFDRIVVPVTEIGKVHFRVWDANKENEVCTPEKQQWNSQLGQMETIPAECHPVEVEFDVNGKDCEPTPIDSIYGDSIICVPTTTGIRMTVSPIDANENVSYHWTLTNPDGSAITNQTVVYEISSSADRLTSITLNLPDADYAPEGDYLLTVFMTKDDGGVTQQVGMPKSKTIHIYKTPKAHFSVDGFVNDGNDAICPSDQHQEITATDNSKLNPAHSYIYSWVNATAISPENNVALISWDDKVQDSLCSGAKNKHQIWETVEIAGVGCKATWDTVLSVTKPVDPEIDCDKLGSAEQEFVLDATQSSVNVTLPVPVVSGTCDRFPHVHIQAVGETPKGEDLSFSIVARLDSLQQKLIPEMNRVFKATAGKSPDKNGIKVTYTVVDGCGKVSNACSITYIVRDVNGPDIPCKDIKDRTTRLSYFGADTCEAYPGKGSHPNELPIITEPVLEDQNGVDGEIKGILVGRLDNQSSKPAVSEAIFKMGITKMAEVNDPFPAGYSYILWKFVDDYGNASYCMQTITVIDDKVPELNCPEQELKDISVQHDSSSCGLSLDSLLAKLDPLAVPSAVDVCPSKTKIAEAVMYYRQQPATVWTKIDDYADFIFKLGNTYDVAWRFYKQGSGATVDKNVYAECIRSFHIVDSVPPIPNCDLLHDTIVTVNINKDGKAEKHASATDKNPQSGAIYSLAGFFKDVPAAFDACEGDITPAVSVVKPDGVTEVLGKASDRKEAILTKLNQFKFPVGASSIVYSYTDSKGNTSECTQSILVYERISLNCQDELTLKADDKCLGHIDFSKNPVRTAKVSFIRQYVKKPYFAMWGVMPPIVDVECDCKPAAPGPGGFGPGGFGPGGFGPGGFGPGAVNCFDEMFKRQEYKLVDSTINRIVDVYPFKVVKVTDVDTNGKPTASSKTTVVENDSEMEEFEQKVVQHQFFADVFNTAKPSSVEKQLCKNIGLKTKNFTADFSEEFTTFTKGSHKLVWYYENGLGDVDSCETIVSVADSTAPEVVCGEWEKDYDLASDPKTCQALLDLKIPTPDDLKASDNCSSIDEIKVTVKREFNGVVSDDITAPFEQGVTHITWIISDKEGIADAYCKQNITVTDKEGPDVDCNKILVSPITVDADENCLAMKEVLVEKGLRIPVLDPSAELCSPTKDPIAGVGYRLNNKGQKDSLDVMKDPYPLGQTTIVWTFADSLGNTTTCTQFVVVEDNSAPEIDCDQFEHNPLTFNLAPTKCSASESEIRVLLGEHFAADNCDADSIPGVPYIQSKNGTTRMELPSLFKKDTTYMLDWVFVDAKGNEKVCHQKLTIADTTPPSTDVCPDPERTIAAKVSCTLAYNELDIPNLQVNDLCDGVLHGVLSGEIQQPGGKVVYPQTEDEFKELSYYAGTVNKFVWTFTDHAGLTSTCEMKLTIADSIPPVIMNCDADKDAQYEMSNGVCYAKWDDISKLAVSPIAYDECQELISGSGPMPLEPAAIKRYFNDSLVAVSTGDDKAWCADPFERGVTKFVWIFKDDAGNTDSCEKSIKIVVRTKPSFICDSIQPNPMRPKAVEGECSVKFADLKFGRYWGFDACTLDSLEAELLIAPVPGAIRVPADLEMKVGDTMKLYWVVVDYDGNYEACPQMVIPSHSNPINFDCNSLDTLKPLALEGECYVPAENVGLSKPYAIDSCAQANGAKPDTIYGVPTRSDGLKLDDNYPTGKTTIEWLFVSPFNIDDTLICSQLVSVGGNKHFDLNCEEILPTVKDTVTDCGPDHDIKLLAPQVPDPCVADTLITAVPVSRTDGAAIDAPFELGNTIVTWTFTDATGFITDTCHQTIMVRTEKDLEKPCDTAAMKTIEVPAPDDACTVPSALVDLGKPYALHPCSKDTVWGVLSRPGISDLSAPYNIGLNKLVWTFTDTTNTLARPIDTCQQFVKVGNVDVEPVDCKNIPDVNIVLEAGDCSIDFSEFKLDIPAVIDRCPNGDPNAEPVEILPTITRTSKKGWSTTNVNEIGAFGVGTDTVNWFYVIAGIEYECHQRISVKDSVAPEFDCSRLKPVQAEAGEGKCEVDSSVVLSLLRPYPKATETCTGDSIEGVPTLEDGTSLPASFRVGDTVIVKWTFIDTTVNVKEKVCYQPVTVVSNAEPIFDCNSLDTLKFIAHDACSINLTEDMLPVPVAKDSCTGADVPGVASRTDGKPVYGSYNTGFVTLTWTFDSPYSTKNKVCSQVVWVVTDLDIDGKCGEENYPTIKVGVADGVCSVPSTDIVPKLGSHTAVNPCHSSWIIEGVPSRSDGKSMDDDFPVGPTVITWTFTDTTRTLLNPVSKCEQRVEVGDNNEPPVDCERSFPAVTLFLDDANCDLDFAAIPVYLDSLPVNACNGDVAVLDTTRESGKPMSAPFEVGKDVIVWTFTFPSNNQTVVCRQKVEVVDTIAPNFDCNQLVPVITVAFTKAGVDYVTYDEIVEKGFYIPTVTDPCCDVSTTIKRSDNLDVRDNYPFGETTVTFTFSDDHGNDKVCSQIIKVTDMVPPQLTCPKIGGTYACLTEVPTQLSYNEFVAAGGSIDDPSRADLTTFQAVDKVVGDSCEALVIRNYQLTSIRADLVTCVNGPDTFSVVDNEAPTYDGIAANGESVNVSCDNVSFNLPEVTAVDNCDPRPSIKRTDYSTQGNDPSKCDYYSYDIVYEWTATDRCNNQAEPVKFTIHVKDTVNPIVHKPVGWDNPAYATYLKKCLFGVPNIVGMLPLDSIELACGGKEYLSITQSPAAGDTIFETTVVRLSIVSVCGNETVLEKTVIVQPRREIVTLELKPDAFICGDDADWNDPRNAGGRLTHNAIRDAYGSLYYQESEQSWTPIASTILWDYYKDTIAESNLVYSNNPTTYASRFADAVVSPDFTPEQEHAADLAYGKYVLLTRRSQSGRYGFVATDTVSGCSDSGMVYINVRERPRINLETSVWRLCEGDSLAVSENGDFALANPVCLDSMGSLITEQGWILNDSLYKPQTPVNYDEGAAHTAIYMATNGCGTSTSMNTLYTDCGAGAPLNHADSLSVFGSEENVALAALDSLYTTDSVAVVVYTHYDPAQVLLSTNPQDKPRIWEGDDAELVVSMPYDAELFSWMRVEGEYDAMGMGIYNRYGEVVEGGNGEHDDVDLAYEEWLNRDSTQVDTFGAVTYTNHYTVKSPSDSAYYYVVVGNGVCPAVSSNLVNIDVMHQLPTAITPYTKDGMNDVFMPRHHVVIFNRYGQMIFEGNNGWDGTYRGILADPGVYFYDVDMSNGFTHKGSIEVLKLTD